MDASAEEPRGYRGFAMEGSIARRYAKLRGTEGQMDDWRRRAADWAAGLPDGAEVLEVAPGPGYFAVELARTRRLRVTGLDISRTFVGLASECARQQRVAVEFRCGSASRMPFADGSFDRVVCQAAFKNFSRPLAAMDEMYRVLRPGGVAVIQDMRREATDAGIREEVAGMQLGRFQAMATRWILRRLRRRAYTQAEFEAIATASSFRGCGATPRGIGIEVRLTKAGSASA